MTTTIADSIALKILNKTTILTGVGNELHRHKTNEKSRHVLPLKLNGKIHGIEFEGNKLLIFGEKEFLIGEWFENENDFKLIKRCELTDWISCGKIMECQTEFVLLTAHSVLLRLVIDMNSVGNIKLLEKSSCTDKSTLYCSHIHGKSWNDLVIFGGNAFGELLIWRPVDLMAPLLKRMQMHNGVIFSIDYDVHTKIISTTSDDRSIRFWNVTLDNNNWLQSELVAKASGYGHVARVFQGKLIRWKNTLYGATVGEDSFFCLWNTNGELLLKRRHQFGAVIWNFEFYNDTLCTVGSTGNLLIYKFTDIIDENALSVNEIMKLSDNIQFRDQYIAKIKFIKENIFVGITNKNKLIVKYADEPWKLITDFPEYKVTVLEVCNDLIVICGYKMIALYCIDADRNELTKIMERSVLNGIIRAFQFLDTATFLISDDLGNCELLKGSALTTTNEIVLPQCKERWLTSALLVNNEFLIVSNRQGNLMLYQLDVGSHEYILRDTLKQLHGSLGCTQLLLIVNNSNEFYVKSCGHDGILRFLRIDKITGKMRIYSKEIVPIAWVETVLYIGTLEILLGFNDNHFVVWSKEYDFLVQIPCGGGHRCWNHYLQNAEEMKLVFIKNKQIIMKEIQLFQHLSKEIQLFPRNKWHVKPCNIMQLLLNYENNQRPILISAGDDNILKISEYDSGNAYVEQKCEIHSHISNIRALKVLQTMNDMALVFSGGGRAQFCITKLNMLNFQIEELINYTLKANTDKYNGLGNLKQQQQYTVDPETRIMSCDVSEIRTHEYLILLGCSDGYVRKLYLNEMNCTLTMAKELFVKRCVLQVRLVGSDYIIVASTKGCIDFYDINLNECILSLPHHSSGVNTLDILYEQEMDILHVLSGGDDQSVSYTALDYTKKSVMKSTKLPQLHTAQVTASHLNMENDSVVYSYTSSVDQNVIKFNLNTDCIENCHHSCVADVKGLCYDHIVKNCYLYGCGLQIFKFQN